MNSSKKHFTGWRRRPVRRNARAHNAELAVRTRPEGGVEIDVLL
jgi:hypothetical protein